MRRSLDGSESIEQVDDERGVCRSGEYGSGMASNLIKAGHTLVVY